MPSNSRMLTGRITLLNTYHNLSLSLITHGSKRAHSLAVRKSAFLDFHLETRLKEYSSQPISRHKEACILFPTLEYNCPEKASPQSTVHETQYMALFLKDGDYRKMGIAKLRLALPCLLLCPWRSNLNHRRNNSQYDVICSVLTHFLSAKERQRFSYVIYMSDVDDIVFGYSWKSRSSTGSTTGRTEFLFAGQTLTCSIDAISEFSVIATTARTIF
jgi:hypothetical protein